MSSSPCGAYVQAQLRVTYQRIYEAIARMAEGADGEEEAWLAACSERETLIDATAPAAWPLSRLALTATESRLLWVLIAHELSPTARLQLRELATETEVDVTLDVIRRVVYGASPSLEVWRELTQAGRLRRDCLIEAVGSEQVPSHRVALRLSPRVLALVHGDLEVDEELRPLLVHKSSVQRPVAELLVDETAVAQLRASMSRASGFTIATGLIGTGRRSLVQAVARELGRDMLVIDARCVSADRAIADRQARIFSRECSLLERLPLIQNLEALEAAENVPDRVGLFESALSSAVFATSARIVARRWAQPVRTIEIVPLSGAQRARLWKQALPEASEGDADLLSRCTRWHRR